MKHYDRYDVVIVGAGMVGATIACLLAQAGHSIALIDHQKPPILTVNAPYDFRVSAINRASQQLLECAGVWQNIIEHRAQAYSDMHVWDATGKGEIHFSAAELGEINLGHIIENRVIQNALMTKLKSYEKLTFYCPNTVEQCISNAQYAEVKLQSGQLLRTQLIIGADGAHSKLREQVNIAINRQDYQQQGIVAIVKPALHHQDTAWQRFMPNGPLAFLPLAQGLISIVWSLPTDKSKQLLTLSDHDFCLALAEAFDYRLGSIEWTSQRAAFPFYGSQAQQYVKPRIALIGDAAHTIHPLAGQGVNLGFRDVLALTEQLKGKHDLGHIKNLRCYERSRRGDNVLTMRAMEVFKDLFGNNIPVLRLLRNTGLQLFNQLPLFKQAIIKKAMGI